jgi:hypothetical protein
MSFLSRSIIAAVFGGAMVSGPLLNWAQADGPIYGRIGTMIRTPAPLVHPMDFPLMPGSPYGYDAENFHNPAMVHQPVYEHQYEMYDKCKGKYVPAPSPSLMRRRHGCGAEVPVTLCFKNPKTGRHMEATTQVPECCAGVEPKTTFETPLIGLGVYTFEWAGCGHVVTIRIGKNGDVLVRP